MNEGLVINVGMIGIHDNYTLGWWNMMLVCLGRNSTIVSWWCLTGQGVIP